MASLTRLSTVCRPPSYSMPMTLLSPCLLMLRRPAA